MFLKRPDQIKPAPSQDGVPPGQFVTDRFPVLTYGPTPKVELAGWRLRIFGLVDKEVQFTWEEFTKLPWSRVDSAFHCVTQWSRLENTWEGVLFRDVMKLVKPKPEAKFVMAHSYGNYSSNLPLDVMMEENVLLAHKHDGKELTREHGWPLRLVVPKRYGWKSAKWLNGLEFMAQDRPGFWEQRGYNNDADPWKEERFWPELS